MTKLDVVLDKLGMQRGKVAAMSPDDPAVVVQKRVLTVMTACASDLLESASYDLVPVDEGRRLREINRDDRLPRPQAVMSRL